MTPAEALVADYDGAGLSLGPHPMTFHRARLERSGVARAADLPGMRHGAPVRVAGAVVVRQRPGTAKLPPPDAGDFDPEPYHKVGFTVNRRGAKAARAFTGYGLPFSGHGAAP